MRSAATHLATFVGALALGAVIANAAPGDKLLAKQARRVPVPANRVAALEAWVSSVWGDAALLDTMCLYHEGEAVWVYDGFGLEAVSVIPTDRQTTVVGEVDAQGKAKRYKP